MSLSRAPRLLACSTVAASIGWGAAWGFGAELAAGSATTLDSKSSPAAATAPAPAPPSRIVDLDYRAPSECPGHDVVVQRVRQMVRRAPATPLLAKATIVRAKQYTLALELEGGRRSVSSDSCKSLAETLTVILALAIDPHAQVAPPTPPVASGDPSARPPSSSANPASSAKPASPASSATPSPNAANSTAAPAASSSAAAVSNGAAPAASSSAAAVSNGAASAASSPAAAVGSGAAPAASSPAAAVGSGAAPAASSPAAAVGSAVPAGSASEEIARESPPDEIVEVPPPRASSSLGDVAATDKPQAEADTFANQWSFVPTVLFGAEYGMLPSVGYGPRVGLWIDHGHFSLVAGAEWLVPQWVQMPSEVRRGGHISYLGGQGQLCYAPSRRARLYGCLGVQAGDLLGKGDGVRAQRLGHGLWLAGVSSVAYRPRLWSKLSADFRIEFSGAVLRPQFGFTGDPWTFDPKWWSLRLAGGFSWTL